ncbi:DNA starvation/stationary phase protection protein [Geothrix limicola]|uniref:DNA starvation/stationary phase protection protein n=1 Tax=Geothrix limicola TaxID=2927978 RepID=A0ABQ5QFE3_9BACT|nr:DNA starvation/stationary phase protection protein Dps [Geothrix limicola]GLH73403.1 DNA starvation/stationary phase protection protein [Geothrix limicola]
MSKHQILVEHELFDEKATEELVAMLNQSLADTLDLAYQTKQAHWNVKGSNFYGLHLLFDTLYVQLSTYVDDFAERAVALGGQAYGTVRAATATSSLEEYPLDAKKSMTHVNALVDRYSDYSSRVRHAIRKAEKLGDKDSADLYTSVSRAMDKALWMLTSHQDV